jgi:hypothetical protein
VVSFSAAISGAAGVATTLDAVTGTGVPAGFPFFAFVAFAATAFGCAIEAATPLAGGISVLST